jgi:hypothetical protein
VCRLFGFTEDHTLTKLFAGDAARPLRGRRHRTAAYYLLLLCLGLSTALTGPTLPALGAQTGTRLGEMGALFLVGALGFTLGTAAGTRCWASRRWRRPCCWRVSRWRRGSGCCCW